MRKSTQERSPVKLSKTFNHQLNLYALGAAAAGVGVTGWAQPVEAKIVYTPANIHISGKIGLDVNHDGFTDFAFSTYYAVGSTSNAYNLKVAPYGANQIVGTNHLPQALRAGVRVGGAQHFYQYYLMARVWFNRGKDTSHFQGDWANGGKGVKNRYLGLKFLIHGKVHYGWARLNVTSIPSTSRTQS
jgi:hypothetical protein